MSVMRRDGGDLDGIPPAPSVDDRRPQWRANRNDESVFQRAARLKASMLREVKPPSGDDSPALAAAGAAHRPPDWCGVEPPSLDRAIRQARGYRSAISDVELRGVLDQLLRASEPGYVGIEAVELDAEAVVFLVVIDPAAPALFRRGFSIDDAGNVQLLDDRERVQPRVAFAPVDYSGQPAPRANASRDEGVPGPPDLDAKIRSIRGGGR